MFYVPKKDIVNASSVFRVKTFIAGKTEGIAHRLKFGRLENGVCVYTGGRELTAHENHLNSFRKQLLFLLMSPKHRIAKAIFGIKIQHVIIVAIVLNETFNEVKCM